MRLYYSGLTLIRSIAPKAAAVELKLRTSAGPRCPIDLCPTVGATFKLPADRILFGEVYGARVGETLPHTVVAQLQGGLSDMIRDEWRRFQAEIKSVSWTVAYHDESEGRTHYVVDLTLSVALSQMEVSDGVWSDDRDWLVDCMFARRSADIAVFVDEAQRDLFPQV